jgi:hypothetical protein
MSDEPVERGCEIVRRYLTGALFGGSERALAETVSDPELAERAWLFWAAFPERTIDVIDVLFASADGSQVGCHFAATGVQDGAWITSTPGEPGVASPLDCTATYGITDGRISTFRETWR